MLKHRLLHFILLFGITTTLITDSLVFAHISEAAVYQASAQNNSREFPFYSENEVPREVQLSGASDQRDFDFPAPFYVALGKNSALNLMLSHSPLLLGDRSALTVYLNNQPLDSIRLDSSNKTDYLWKVALPENVKPEDGRYRISLSANMRTSDINCPLPDDPASWIKIDAASTVQLQLSSDSASPDLKNLSQYFFSSRSLLDRQITVVAPEVPTDKDLSRVSQLVARLGVMAGFDGLNLNLSYGVPNIAYANRIYIGGPALFPLLSEMNLKLTAGSDGFKGADKEAGVLQLAWNQNGNGVALVVSGNSDNAVDRALGTLLDSRGLNILQGEYSLIQPDSEYKYSPEDTKLNLNPVPKDGRNIFANLGYNNQTARGIGLKETRFNFFIPGSNTIDSDALLGIDLSYSGASDSKRSSLSIVVNDVALQAIPLTNRMPTTTPASNTEVKPARLNLSIPSDLLRNGDNSLVFRWNFRVDHETLPCYTEESSDLWGTIFRTSEMTIKLGESGAKSFDLGSVPYPFSGSKNVTMVVISEKSSVSERRVAAQLIAEFGRSEPFGRLDRILLVHTDKVSKEQLAGNNIVLVGTPVSNQILADVNAKLPIKWDSDTSRSLSTQWGLKLAISDAGTPALLQVTSSPWGLQQNDSSSTSQFGLMAVLVPANMKEDYQERFVNSIARRLYVGKYEGNVLVVDSSGKATSLNTLKQTQAIDPSGLPSRTASVSVPPTINPVDSGLPSGTPAKTGSTTSVSRDNSAIFLGAAAVTVFLVVAFIFFVRRSRKTGGGGR